MTTLDEIPAAGPDAATRVRTLIALTEELADIIGRENELLASRRPKEIAPLQHDKARLAAAYAQSIRQIAVDRSLVAGAGDALIERLRDITQSFEERAEAQKALLDGARRAAEGVVKAVAAEAAKPISYSRSGAPGPIALNRQA